VWTIDQTNASVENKELMSMFGEQKEKLWAISKQRLGQKGGEDFATELDIQEAGFQVSTTGMQLGVKKLWVELLDGLKDIIVQFWDKPYWFKITGTPGVDWYKPEIVIDPTTNEKIVKNALTDVLTGDYEIDIDVISSMKPNKEKEEAKDAEFAEWLTSPNLAQFLASKGWSISIEAVKRVIQKRGWNAETMLEQLSSPPVIPGMPGVVPPEGAPINAPV
jgi:hypothetical protein